MSQLARIFMPFKSNEMNSNSALNSPQTKGELKMFYTDLSPPNKGPSTRPKVIKHFPTERQMALKAKKEREEQKLSRLSATASLIKTLKSQNASKRKISSGKEPKERPKFKKASIARTQEPKTFNDQSTQTEIVEEEDPNYVCHSCRQSQELAEMEKVALSCLISLS